MAETTVNATEKQNVEVIINKYPGIFDIMADRNKILCKLTKHELPLSVKALESYTSGKRFQLLLKKVKKPEVVLRIDEKFKEYFVPSKKSSSRLFCTLTKKEINKLPHEIEKYITGYKFLKALHKEKERKEKGIEAVQDTNDKEENAENENEEAEEGDIPFFALSDNEDGSDEEEGEEGNDDDVIEDEEDDSNKNGDVDMKDNEGDETSLIPDEKEESEEKVNSIIPDEKENIDVDTHGKKRKTKPSKSKKDRKTKKVKHGAK